MAWVEARSNNRFYVRWLEGKASRYAGPFRSKTEANQYRDEIKVRVNQNRLGIADTSRDPTEILDQYLRGIEKTHKERTVEHKHLVLSKLLQDFREIGHVNAPAIIRWREEMMTKYRIDTVALRLRELRAFLSYCVECHYLPEHPMKGITIPVSRFEGRCLTNEEVKRLLDVSSGLFRTFLIVALYTGARVSEILRLDWADIRDATWTIRGAKNTDTRLVYLIQPVMESLGMPKQGPIFGEWGYDTIRHYFGRARAAAGIQGRLRIHDLRHTWASNYRGDMRLMMFSAGWRDPRMAKKYSHPQLEHLKEGMETVRYE
jgi:integrase